MDPLLIYGATGYTGRLIVLGALERGLRPVLGGRDEARLAAEAARWRLAYRVAPLDDAARLDAALRDVAVVLHAAGPFSRTAEAMADACLRAGAHYLDLSGEIDAIEAVRRRDAEARRRGRMLLPGCGFDVVPSDCLAAHVARRLPGASRLALGVSGLVFASRGSLRTIAEQAGRPVRVRRGGELTEVAPGSLRRTFDYGSGARASLAVGWGDVATAFYTTGIPDVTVYFERTPALEAMLGASRLWGAWLVTPVVQAWLQAQAALWPEGPTPAVRAGARAVVVAEAERDDGARATARLEAPEAYTASAASAPALAERVLAGDLEPGFQTPGRVYGPDFVLGLPDVQRIDL